MFIYNRQTQLIKFFILISFIFSMNACTENLEEEILPPKEITDNASLPDQISLENWKLFIHAPMDVLEKFKEEEKDRAVRTIFIQEEKKADPNLVKSNAVFLIKGSVKAFDGSWRAIPNVQIESAGNATLSSYALGGGSFNYFFGASEKAPICMSFSSSADNGLSSLDLVLIKKHLEGINPFTSIREYLAADVNRDGLINDVDVFQIESLLLERETELPETDNVLFVSEKEFNRAQALLEEGDLDDATLSGLGRISSCLESSPDRFMIKSGDVNGTTIF